MTGFALLRLMLLVVEVGTATGVVITSLRNQNRASNCLLAVAMVLTVAVVMLERY